MCQEEHPPWYCTTYTTPRERINALKAKGLCGFCGLRFKAGHQCFLRPCANCGGRHMAYVCLKNR